MERYLPRGMKPDQIDESGWTPLHNAVRDGEAKALRKMLTLKPKIDIKVGRGHTPLHIAVRQRDVTCFRLLLDAGANVNVPDGDGILPLHLAAEIGEAGMLKQMLNLCDNVNIQDAYKFTPLDCAIRAEMLDCVDVLLNAGADASIRYCNTILFIAVRQGNDSMVKRMLQRNVDVNICESRGENTPLHIALIKKKLNCIDDLLNAGARVDIQNIDGVTPVHIALAVGYESIADKMLDLKPEVNIKDGEHPFLKKKIDTIELLFHNEKMDRQHWRSNYGETPLHLAANHGYESILKKLIDLKVDVNMQDNRQCTALHIALREGKLNCVDALINAGANVNIQDSGGRTPLYFAANHGYESILKKLIDLKADVNMQDVYQCTALHIALGEGKLDCVDALINAGANVNMQDCEGRTPLHITVSQRYERNCLRQSFFDALPTYSTFENENPKSMKISLNDKTDLNIKDRDGRIALNSDQDFVRIVKKLIEMEANLNIQDEKGRTPLHVAIKEDKIDCMDALLNAGAHVDVQDNDGRTLLHVAIQRNKCYDSIVNKLLQQNIDVNISDRCDGNTPLHISLLNEKLAYINELLNAGARVDIQNANGTTALHIALAKGYKGVAKKMLGLKPDVNIKDGKRPSSGEFQMMTEIGDNYKDILVTCGRTPLHLAVKQGFDNIVKILLDLMADVSIQDVNGCIPLHIALREGKLDCVDALLNASTDVDFQHRGGDTSLHLAIKLGYKSIVMKLLNLKADVNKQGSRKRTPLHVALNEGKLDCVDFLLHAGADINIEDLSYSTPLKIALENGHKSIWKKLLGMKPQILRDHDGLYKLFQIIIIHEKMDYFDDLLEAGASLDAANSHLLHVAAKHCSEIMLQKLLGFNLDVNVQDRYGLTPLHVVCSNHNQNSANVLNCALLLLDAGARWDIMDHEKQTMMCQLIDSLWNRSFDGDPNLLKRILEITNGGEAIDYYTKDTAAHRVIKHIWKSNVRVEFIKLVLSTQKNLNVKNHSGNTVLNCIIENLRQDHLKEIITQLIQMCIEHGGYLASTDCDKILSTANVQDGILRDVTLCTKSIVNEFNYNTLSQFYEYLNGSTFVIPIEALRINPDSVVWGIIQEDVRSELERKGYCHVSQLVTTSLSKRCVESYCNALRLRAQQQLQLTKHQVSSKNTDSDDDYDYYDYSVHDICDYDSDFDCANY